MSKNFRIGWGCFAFAAMLGGTFLSAEETRRAVPVAEPVDNPVPRAVPVNPSAPPPGPAAIPVAPAVPAAPKSPDEDLFDYATLCYSQKDYQVAVKPYSDYVRLYSQGSHASEAWFRLGECHLKLGQDEEAKQAYLTLLSRFPKSEGAASACYRLGAFEYNARDFGKAAQYFESCDRLTTDTVVKLAAIYNKALSYKLDNQPAKAYAAYKAVVATKGDNPYRDSALVEVAASALAAGKNEDALAAYMEIISEAKDTSAIGDALVKSGLLLNESGKTEAAIKNFKRALDIKGLSPELRGVAVYGLIQGYYTKGDYKAVVETYIANSNALPTADLRPKMLLMIGNSQKQLQAYRQAIEIYLILERQFPESREAFEGAYQKLVCFFQLGDKDVPQFSETFEQRYSTQYKGDEYLIMARLIRADCFFAKPDYAKAAEALSGVDMSKVPEKVRASELNKKGYAETEAGKYNEGIGTYTEFISGYPTDANIPMAFAQRGMCYKNVRAFEKALADFTTVISTYPDSPAAEEAYYQTGLIKAETRDLPGMITAFETFVSKFPHSPGAAQAWYQIGLGYFEQKTKESYAKAITPLHKSAELDTKGFLDKASTLLISCQYLREDVDGTAKEIDAYWEARHDAGISPAVLIWVGVKNYERGNFRAAARYLSRVSTPSEPTSTDPMVWNYLGLSQLENGDYDDCVKAFDNYLAQTPEGEGHIRALLSKGRALLNLGKFDDADNCANEALGKVKEGRLHAKLQLLQGDVAMAHGNALEAAGDHAGAMLAWKKAAGSYVVVSQIFVDPEITPEALDKAAQILDKIGEPEKAESLRKMLASKYPTYKAKDAK